MKPTAIIFSVLILISSCATLNINEIRNLEKTEFDSLTLIPDWEANNLRIDLIRQTYEEDVNDSTTESKKTPYHPIGFNLGNGLFYDLNKNLCLRLDYILDFSEENSFEIQKTTRPVNKRKFIIYQFLNDSLLVRYPPRKKAHYRYHRITYSDSLVYMYKKRLKYAVIRKDSALIYSGKKRKWDVIHKIDDNNYYLNKKWRKENYQIKDNSIVLEHNYVVSLLNDNSRIEIKSYRKNGKGRILYTLERDPEKLFIYNKYYSGLRIEKDGNNILIYRNNTLLGKYELKSGAPGKYR